MTIGAHISIVVRLSVSWLVDDTRQSPSRVKHMGDGEAIFVGWKLRICDVDKSHRPSLHMMICIPIYHHKLLACPATDGRVLRLNKAIGACEHQLLVASYECLPVCRLIPAADTQQQRNERTNSKKTPASETQAATDGLSRRSHPSS